ncbi:MAG: ThuA domain-containing protein [Verrucomicrobiota bacterium]
MKSLRACFCLIAGVVTLGAGWPRPLAAESPAWFRVLIFSKTTGYRHASITNGIAAIRQLGAEHNFGVDATEDSTAFTRTNLARYQAVVFLSVTGEVLDAEQKAAFQDYVMRGGGLAAIHGGVFGPSACEGTWAWYGEMFCCAFTNHSGVAPATINVEDGADPSMKGLPARWQRTDEWYNFTGTPRGCARVLATVDESTYAGGTMGGDHPIAWRRRVGQGRMWYTAMGHTPETFSEPLFVQHLLGGILSVAARAPADFAPNARVAADLAWNRAEDAVTLLENGHAVWRFNFGTNESKPFFNPVSVPGVPDLTWDRPPDHRWHHALWFSWKFINGVNYWEEKETGRAEGLTLWREPRIETRPDFSARIVMDLEYQPAGEPAVMSEHRVIEVSPPDQEGAYYLDWALTFTAADKDVLVDRTPLPGEPGGQSWGGYAGLSVRFAHAMEDIRVVTSQGPVGFTDGMYRGRASAMDYSGVIEKREAGVCILDHPGNLNTPSPWYAINNGAMSYFSPAVLSYQPYLLKARQSLCLRYRVLVHAGRWSAEQLRLGSQRYTEQH